MPYYHPPDPSPGDRLRDLADYLRQLAGHVRQLAAEAIGDTLARLAKDTSDRVFKKVVNITRQQARPDPHDEWDEDEDTYERKRSPSMTRTIGRTLVAGLLWGSGWWLRKRRSPWAAAAVAVAGVLAALFSGSGEPVSGEWNAAADLLAAHDALSAGSHVLSGH